MMLELQYDLTKDGLVGWSMVFSTTFNNVVDRMAVVVVIVW
jgi:hypothetical protein